MIKRIKKIYYGFINGVINVKFWFKTIWKDRDWDYDYIFAILKRKLEKMEKLFNSDYVLGENSKKEAEQMRYTINLLDRLINQPYLEEALKPFYEKYPDYEFKFEFERCSDNPKFHKLINRDTPEQREFLRKCYDKSQELEDKDLNELFDYMKEHIRSWWD